MPFESLKQAFYLWTQSGREKTVFRNIAGRYGVPEGWQEYKIDRIKKMGFEPTTEFMTDIDNFGLERAKNKLSKWQIVLKNRDEWAESQLEKVVDLLMTKTAPEDEDNPNYSITPHGSIYHYEFGELNIPYRSRGQATMVTNWFGVDKFKKQVMINELIKFLETL